MANKNGSGLAALPWAPLGDRHVEYVVVDGFTYYRHANDATYERGPGGSTKTAPVATTGGGITMPNGITATFSAYRRR